MLQCTWPDQCIKTIPQNLSRAIHLVRAYLMTDFSTPSPLYAYGRIQSNPLFAYILDFIDLILSTPLLISLVCHNFLILFYLRNSRVDVFFSDTHHFLASYSVSSSLSQKAISLIVASNCQLFYYVFMITDEAYLCKCKGELLQENYYCDCYGSYESFEFQLRKCYNNNTK